MGILITGANGFLGGYIINELGKYEKVYSLSRTSGFYIFSLERQIPVFNNKFNLVVHTAGKAHSVPKTEHEKQLFHDVNVFGTQNLLKGLKNIGIPTHFVFISSVAVYGKDLGENINEDYPLFAKDAYGRSKIEAEKLIIDWCQENGVIYTILRLPLIIGKNPPGNLGNMLNALKMGFYFNIGGGIAKKSMVLAEDVAMFIPKIATVGGIYNLTDGEHPSFLALSKILTKKNISNLPLFVAKIFGFIGDILGDNFPINSLKIKKITSVLTFDDSKARAMGWKPQSVLEYLKLNKL